MFVRYINLHFQVASVCLYKFEFFYWLIVNLQGYLETIRLCKLYEFEFLQTIRFCTFLQIFAGHL